MRVATFLFAVPLHSGRICRPLLKQSRRLQQTLRPSDQKSQNSYYGLGTGAHRRQPGTVDILSNTQSVDFGLYLQGILKDVKENWYHLIPESASRKKGELAIEFASTRDGRGANMRMVSLSGDVALDRRAWGSITASNPFPPLPYHARSGSDNLTASAAPLLYQSRRSEPSWIMS
jgi:TonB C terminal